jgi:hypothetical protein
MSYTIIKINENNSVDVSFDCDNKVQNISNFPVGNQEELDLALQNYEEAYVSGLKLESKIK